MKVRTLVTGCALPAEPRDLHLTPVPVENSARLWNEAFQAIGWQVQPPTLNITTPQLKRKLAKLVSYDGPIVWVWLGHGLQLWDTNQDEPDHYDEALLTYDTDTQDTSTWFTDDDLWNAFAPRWGHRYTTLVIIDACHAAGWLSDRIPPTHILHDSPQLGTAEWRILPPSTIISVATAPENAQAWFSNYIQGSLLQGTWALATLLRDIGRRRLGLAFKTADWLKRALRRLGSPHPVVEASPLPLLYPLHSLMPKGTRI